MRNPLSKLVTEIEPSGIRRFFDMTSTMDNVISLGVGEPDFDTPWHIREEGIYSLEKGRTFYTSNAGLLELRKEIAAYLERRFSLAYEADEIIVTVGGSEAIDIGFRTMLDPGDEVIIPMPAWVSYVEMVKLAGGKTVEIHADIKQEFKITPEQLEAAITPATRMILICSPSNPTGSIYSREELEALVKVLAKYPDIMVLADEIYEHINFTGSFTSMASFPEIADRTVIINGVSKAYAMTGWRIGYCAAPQWLAKAVTKLQGQYTSNASSIAQKAAEAAYTGSQECIAEMNKAFERRRDLVVKLASEIPGLKVNRPQGAFYLFPEVSAYLGKTTPDGKKIETSGDLAMYLLESGHVATVDGGAFGMEGYIRLSYATSDDNLREALRRIREALLNLK